MSTIEESNYINNNDDEKEEEEEKDKHEVEKIIEDNFNCLINFKNQCIYCDEDLGSLNDSRQLCNKLNCNMFINNVIKIK